jgi:hypothetical protein
MVKAANSGKIVNTSSVASKAAIAEGQVHPGVGFPPHAGVVVGALVDDATALELRQTGAGKRQLAIGFSRDIARG